MSALINLRRAIWASKSLAPVAMPSSVAVDTSGNMIKMTPDATAVLNTTVLPRVYFGVCFMSGLNRLIAWAGNPAGAFSAFQLHSDDGVAFVEHTMPISACWLDASPTRVVAVGNGVTAYSDDGENWTAGTIPAGLYQFVKYIPELGFWYAISNAGSVVRSADGITFVAFGTAPALSYANMDYNPTSGTMVATAYGNSVAYSANDGLTWISYSVGYPSRYGMFANRVHGLFMVGGQFGSSLPFTMTTGATVGNWISRGNYATLVSMFRVPSMNKSVGIRFASALSCQSSNGTTWTNLLSVNIALTMACYTEFL